MQFIHLFLIFTVDFLDNDQLISLFVLDNTAFLEQSIFVGGYEFELGKELGTFRFIFFVGQKKGVADVAFDEGG